MIAYTQTQIQHICIRRFTSKPNYYAMNKLQQ